MAGVARIHVGNAGLGRFLGAEEKSVEKATERVIAYGATSGVDLIVGIILGFTLLERGSR
ncbi:MAG: hypothetical protein NT045_06060 [Candidatus Aureabacteria bacterium]|nr:hypothetical protein [Candidatus Auribacterota bacterium]